MPIFAPATACAGGLSDLIRQEVSQQLEAVQVEIAGGAAVEPTVEAAFDPGDIAGGVEAVVGQAVGAALGASPEGQSMFAEGTGSTMSVAESAAEPIVAQVQSSIAETASTVTVESQATPSAETRTADGRG